VAHCD